MRKPTIVLTLVAVAALVAAGTQPSLAGAGDRLHAGNSGQIARGAVARTAPLHRATPNSPDFDRIKGPTSDYTTSTCVTDLSAIADETMLTKIDSNCGPTLSFSATMTKVSVPNTWATWASPPKSEGAAPDALWAQGATVLTISYSAAQTIGGLEIEPDQFQQETISADFYTGKSGSGERVGTIIRRHCNGSSGARLFAVQSTTAWRSIVITDLAASDFAIARLRTSL